MISEPDTREDRCPSEPPPATSAGKASSPAPERKSAIDLSSSQWYLNRELTWLAFNERVLHEAEDSRTPLLERVKFLSIVASNLDEFFMKRIGGLKQQVGAGLHELTVDGRTPQQQIAECYGIIRTMELRQQKLLHRLLKLLREQGIPVVACSKLTKDEQKRVREYYLANIFPLVTPQVVDPAHPFPFVSNLSLNLLVGLRHPGDSTQILARVKVPVGAGIPRFLKPAGVDKYVRLEDVMAHNLDLLFPDMEIDSCELFRVTRNADTERDEEQAEDLLAMIQTELRERKLAPTVRLVVESEMSAAHRGQLASELGLDESADVFEVDGVLGLHDLMELARIDRPDLHDPSHAPIDHPKLPQGRSIFHLIRQERSILLMHPYESFVTSVERLLREASEDPKVRAIKMTLYRTSEQSRVVDSLIAAARNGKQVTVAVEIKARFDEEANIRWATQLEEAGIHVTYGIVGLKTHCKVILIVRQDFDGLRRYAHIGTGNYHSETSRLYFDMGLLTCDDAIGQDCTELFNYLTTGLKPRRTYQKLLVAPKMMKPLLLEKIAREIRIQKEGGRGAIQIKTNSLEDPDLTRALYEASMAGVKVDLIVRDSCRLRPGVPGLSENIRVISIVGRFLEHARIFYFRNGGNEEYYIGSADLLKRKLEMRVEAAAPVESPDLQKTLRFVLDAQLADPRSAWDMQPDGTYVQRHPERGRKSTSSQQQLIDWSDTRHREATRLRKRRAQGVLRRGQSE